MEREDYLRLLSKVRVKGSKQQATKDRKMSSILEEYGLFRTQAHHIWIGRFNTDGITPVFDLHRRPQVVRKLLWEHFNGPITDFPDGTKAQVLRSCDEPKCVNPAHLYLGTVQERVDAARADQRAKWKEQEEREMKAYMKRQRRN